MAFYDKWLDMTMQRLGYAKAGPLSPPTFAGESPLNPELNFTAYDDAGRERLALTSSWVYSDIDLIAKKVAQARVCVYARKGEELVEEKDHDFERLMARPNPHMSGAFLWRYTIWWWLLRGESYWWKIPDRTAALAQIWPMPADRMEPIPSPDKYISGYRYRPTQGRQFVVLPPEQVVFFRFPNPFDYHRGLSPLSAYRMALETDIAAVRWNRDTFVNDVTLRTLISLPQELTGTNYEMRKQELVTELIENHRRFMISRTGQVDVKNMSIAPKDLEFLAGREFTREEIDRVFGIPAGYWAKEATRANSEQAEATLIGNAVWPLMTLAQADVTAQAVEPAYGQGYEAQFEDIRVEDRSLLVEERRQYWLVKTVDEAREELGLKPLPDVELGGTLVPLATKAAPPAASAGSAQAVPPPASEPESEPMTGGGEEWDEEGEIELPEAKADLKRWQSIARRRLRDGGTPAYDFESEYIPPLTGAIVKAALDWAGSEEEIKAAFAVPHAPRPFDNYHLLGVLGLCDGSADVGHVLSHPEEYTAKAILGATDEVPQYRLDLEDGFTGPVQNWLEGQAGRVFVEVQRAGSEIPSAAFWRAEDAALAGFLASYLEDWALAEIGQAAGLLAGAGLGIDATVNARAAAWAGEHALELARGLNATTRDLAKAKIKNWLMQPSRLMEDLERSLRGIIGPKWRASLIAQTEITRALSAARQEVVAELGPIVKNLVWQTSRDERVCPICRGLNGTLRTPGGQYPGGYSAPPAHVRCRCGESMQV